MAVFGGFAKDYARSVESFNTRASYFYEDYEPDFGL